MAKDKQKSILPDNPSWDNITNLCAKAISDRENRKVVKVIFRPKWTDRRWFIAWVITAGALIGTNIAWILAIVK